MQILVVQEVKVAALEVKAASQEVKDKMVPQEVKVKEDQEVKAGQTGKMAAVITRIAIILAAARLQPNSLVKHLQSGDKTHLRLGWVFTFSCYYFQLTYVF
jgi:hypothetical protein